MNSINGLPQGTHRPILTDHEIVVGQLNNQFVLNGNDPSFIGNNIIVFLEQVNSTSFVINDKDGIAISDTITEPINLTASPMRIDGGVQLSGSIAFAKGFYINKTVEEK